MFNRFAGMIGNVLSNYDKALFGLMAPFTAALVDKYGFRRVVLVAVALIEIGLLGALGMTKLWHLVLFWGVIVGFGTGLTAMVLGALVATRWFSARRGLVVGILSASSASGQLLLLPLAAWLADRYGWRVALAPPAIALVVIAILVALFLVDKPEDVGLKPYGDKGDTPAHVAPPAAFGRAFEILFESTRSPAFWVLAGTFFVCGLSTNGLIQTHFIAFCGDYGLPAVAAASTLAMMGVFDFIGTIGSGWLSDRFDNRALLSMYYGLRGLSLLWLPHSDFSFYGLSLFAMFYGLDWVATVPPTAHTAMALARRAGLPYACLTSASEAGSMTAAALPWTARPAIRNPSVGARPHAADEARNAARPMAYRRLAPIRSEIAPAEMSRAANISVYASITHCRPAVDPPRVRSMPARATFTAVESRLSMKNPSSEATRTITLLVAGSCPALPVMPPPSRVRATATAAGRPGPKTPLVMRPLSVTGADCPLTRSACRAGTARGRPGSSGVRRSGV